MVMQPRIERAFQPGQVVQAQLTITNDGDLPIQYAVEVSPGAMTLLGFVGEGTFVFITDVVEPGRSLAVNFPLALPAAISEGSKVVRVRIGEAGPAGELVSLLDEQLFGGRLRVEFPAPPAPPPIEAIPLPEEPELPEGLSPGDLTLATPTVTPTTVAPGEAITIQVPFLNVGPVAVPVSIDPFIVDSAGRVALTVPRDTFTPQLGMELTRSSTLTIPTDMPGGSYGLLVMAVDTNTGVLLLQQTFPNLFTVVVPEVAPPPPPVPEEVAPPPPPPAELGAIDSLDVPSSVELGNLLSVRVGWRTSVPAYVTAALLEPPGFTGFRSATSTQIRPTGSYSDELRITVDLSNAEGDNRLRVSLVSQAGETLAERTTTVTVYPGI